MELKSIKDISTREDEGVRRDFVHPNDDKDRFWMRIAGVNSARFRAARARQQQRWLRSRRTKQTPAEIAKDRIEIAAACVIEWGDLTDGGQPVLLTPENLELVLTEEWVIKGVEEAMNDEQGFFASSSKA